jgi:hypothetical protein
MVSGKVGEMVKKELSISWKGAINQKDDAGKKIA